MKVLVIRLSAIGDIVLTSATLRCIGQQRPDVRLHYLTKQANAHLLAHCPYLDKVHSFDGDMRATLAQLREEHFDLVIDLHHNFRSLYWRIGLHCKCYTFEKRNFTKWLITTLHLPLQVPHVALRYMEVQPAATEHTAATMVLQSFLIQVTDYQR